VSVNETRAGEADGSEKLGPVAISIVVPLRDEVGNVDRLVGEVRRSMRESTIVREFELLCVDDGSTDGTLQALNQALASGATPELSVLALSRAHNKESALAAGVDAAAHDYIALLDADLQVVPSDLEPLLVAMLDEKLDCVSGARTDRLDTWTKRASSTLANGFRGMVLGDSYSDINCPLKIVRAEALRAIPRFRAWHRYIPVLIALRGGSSKELPVSHFERMAGRSKYGVWNRLWIGLQSLAVVWWLRRNRIEYQLRTNHDD
jgi:glycosyltransferase involved in cell wall biosynthesis